MRSRLIGWKPSFNIAGTLYVPMTWVRRMVGLLLVTTGVLIGSLGSVVSTAWPIGLLAVLYILVGVAFIVTGCWQVLP